MKENIPAVTRTHIDVDCCDSSAVFVVDLARSVLA